MNQQEHTNGAMAPPDEARPRVPAIDDVVMQSLGERWDTIREMLEHPTFLAHSIPRSVLSQREATDMLRSKMLHLLWHNDTWDEDRLHWQKQALSVSVDGRGRKEAVEIATSAVHRVVEQQDRKRIGPKSR